MEERRGSRIVRAVALLAAVGLIMVWGMVVGGGLVYAWTQFVGDAGDRVQTRTITMERLGVEGRGQVTLPSLDPLGEFRVEVVPGAGAHLGSESGGVIIVPRILEHSEEPFASEAPTEHLECDLETQPDGHSLYCVPVPDDE